LDQVHEEALRQLGAVDVVAQPGFVLLRKLPLVVLKKKTAYTIMSETLKSEVRQVSLQVYHRSQE
jgi:hypothetical protein